jgi:hypothetical protein
MRKEQRANKTKYQLSLFDSLQLETKEKTFSRWTGDKGVYVFKPIEKTSGNNKRTPLRQVYLNREYLTGIFKTKIETEFSGDIKSEFDSERRYLVFRAEAGNIIKIFEKVYCKTTI